MQRIACLPFALGIAAIAAVAVAPSAVAAPLPGNGQIAFVDTSGSPSIGIANADGSMRRTLTRTLPFMSQPAWDPKAKRIAFVLGDRIALIRPDGSGLRPIGSRTLAETAPSWSPEGQLAFVRERSVEGNAGSDLVVVRGDGSHQRVLALPESLTQPETFSWATDGHHVLWSVPRGNAAFAQILSLDVRTGTTTLRPQPSRCVRPAVTQPGGTLAVCFQAESSPPRLKLLRDGKRLGYIARVGRDGPLAQPAWSPQGSRLAYGIDRQHVAVLTLEAGQTRTYAIPMRGPDGGATVSWSPDGLRLVVGAGQAGGWRLAEIDLESGKVRTIAAHAEDSSPRFSPDGKRLAFVRTPAAGPRQLRVIDGTTRTVATGVSVDGQLLDLPADYNWSPGSRAIAYTTDAGTLATVDVATGTVRTLARTASGQPFWSPDGTTIAFQGIRQQHRDPAYGQVRLAHADGTGSSVAPIAGEAIVLGFTPDGTGMLVSRPDSTASILAIADGSTLATFPYDGALGSSLSPVAGGSIMLTLSCHEGCVFGAAVTYQGAQAAGTSPYSSAPPAWSPDGAAIAFSIGDPGEIRVAPAANLDALGPPIEHAREATWQPVPIA